MLSAGSAMVDVTPPMGSHLGGTWGVLREAKSIADPLFARAVVFECEGKRACIVAVDLEILTGRWHDKIRDAATAKTGIPREAILVHFSQTHSSPPVGNFILDEDLPNVPPEHEYLRGSQSGFCEWAVERIVEAIVKADAAREPTEIGMGRAVRDDLAFNRRAVQRDGKVMMPWFYADKDKPLGPTEISHMEGPADPEVGVVCLREKDQKITTALLHHTCHPVNLFATEFHVVSSDWPGTWSQGVRERAGDRCVPLVINAGLQGRPSPNGRGPHGIVVARGGADEVFALRKTRVVDTDAETATAQGLRRGHRMGGADAARPPDAQLVQGKPKASRERLDGGCDARGGRAGAEARGGFCV